MRLAPRAPRVLGKHELVRVGRVWLEIRADHSATSPPSATRELALALVAEARRAKGEEASALVSARTSGRVIAQLALSEADRPYVVGRAGDGGGVDLDLPDPDLSRRHLEIRRRGDRIMVRDLGSKNGSRLGDQALPPQRETSWPQGQLLACGTTELEYSDPLLLTLRELEEEADEVLGKDAIIDGPSSDTPDPSSETGGDEEPDAAASLEETAARHPTVAQSAAAARARMERSAPRGWSASDVLVALLALGVLALSIAGLAWLVGW